jgi:hypothetical protein
MVAQQHTRKTIGTPHKRSARHRPKESRGNSSSRGYDARWERFRRAFLIRNPLCEYCMARGHVTPATVCDHDLPHDADPELFWDNTFTALCKWDHDSTKQRMERRYKGQALLQAVRAAKGL